MQVWYRNNKAAEKYSADDIIAIFEDTLQHIQDNPEIFLKIDVEIYLLTKHSICKQTRHSWISKIHKDNISIRQLNEGIESIIESRLVQKEKGIRPNIQAMVLQNKHDYRERSEQKIDGGATITINRPEQPADKPKE